MLLVDQSDSVEDKEAVRDAVVGFIHGLFSANNTNQYEGGILIRIAGFDGRPGLIEWTESMFVSNITHILDYVNASMRSNETITSTDLYGPYMDAIDILDAEWESSTDDELADYTSLVIFTDGTDRAERHTLEEVRAKVDASDISTFWAVTVAGEQESEYEEFLSFAGVDGLWESVATTSDALSDAFYDLFWRMTVRSKNVYIFLYCSAVRSGEMATLELQFGDHDAPIRVEYDSSVFDTTNVSNQCNQAAADACTGCGDVLVMDTEAGLDALEAAQSCNMSNMTAYVKNETVVEDIDGLAYRYTAYCPLVPCDLGFTCVSGFCVNLTATRLQEIDHIVEAPSNVLIAFSLVGTLQDGSCGPVTFGPEDTHIVEESLVIREDGVLASEDETFLGLVQRPLQFRLKVMLLVDQSDSVEDKEAVRDAVVGFIHGLFSANNTNQYEGGILIRIAGFDGRPGLIEWTESMFVSNITHILDYVNASMRGDTFTSTDLYGPYMQAIDILDAEFAKSLNDTIADYSSLVVFTDGTDRAQRHTVQEVADKLAVSNLSTAWVVPNIGGEQGAEYEEFLNISGKDGIFPVAALTAFQLKRAFDDLFWRISIRTKNIYIFLYCSAIRNDETVKFEISWRDSLEPVTFDVDTSVFETDDIKNQCDAKKAEDCEGCVKVLNLANKDGLENIQDAQKCTCEIGYYGEGILCLDLDECTEVLDDCHARATCHNTVGSFECECDIGFEGNGTVCNDIDECLEETTNTCDENAMCNNTYGSFECHCNAGYEGNGTLCENLLECELETDDCHMEATCSDTIGSFLCNCSAGWDGNGTLCSDIDECVLEMDNCHPEQGNCSNTIGSFDCICDTGYGGDGVECDNLLECDLETDNCAEFGSACSDTVGSFTCECVLGWTGNGTYCFEIDECSLEEDNCHLNATCTNIDGSFECDCDEGFAGDGLECEPMDREYAQLSTTFGLEGMTAAEFTVEAREEFRLACVQEVGYAGPGQATFEIGAILETATGGLSIEIIIIIFGWIVEFETISLEASLTTVTTTITTFSGGGGAGFLSILGGFPFFGSWAGFGGLGFSLLRAPASFEWSEFEGIEWTPPTFSRSMISVDRGLFGMCGIQWGAGFDIFSSELQLSFRQAFAFFLNIDISWFTIASVDSAIVEGRDLEISFQIVSYMYSISLTSLATKIETGFADGGIEAALRAQDLEFESLELLVAPEVFDCPVGYNASGVECLNIDECALDIDTCATMAHCMDTNGSFTCECFLGYAGDDGTSCTNIDECRTGADNCDAAATCTDTAGSFECDCDTGYNGDGLTCANIDECDVPFCLYERIIVNCTNGTTYIADKNNENYDLNLTLFTPPDGCNATVGDNLEPCPSHTCLTEGVFCHDTNGSFTCECETGYARETETTCLNIDECVDEIDTCNDDLGSCVDTAGSYNCKCIDGWKGDGINCTNHNECREFADNNCNALAVCTDTVGSFLCACQTDYEGDGTEVCDYSPPVGTIITTVVVTFTVTVDIDVETFSNNETIQANFRAGVARAANVDVNIVIIISITVQIVNGRRVLAESAAVETQMTMPEKQFNDVQGSFEENLNSALADSGIGMQSLSSLDVTKPKDEEPPAEEEEEEDDDSSVDGGIIGGAIAGVLALFALGAAFTYYVSKMKGPEPPVEVATTTKDVEAPYQPVPEPAKEAQPVTMEQAVPVKTDLAFMQPQAQPFFPSFMPPAGVSYEMPAMGSMPPMSGSMPPMAGSMPPMGMPGMQPPMGAQGGFPMMQPGNGGFPPMGM